MLKKLSEVIDKYRDEREAHRVMMHLAVEFGLEMIRRNWTTNQELTKDFSPGGSIRRCPQVALSGMSR
jgi:hypothetical protein